MQRAVKNQRYRRHFLSADIPHLLGGGEHGGALLLYQLAIKNKGGAHDVTQTRDTAIIQSDGNDKPNF